MSISFPHLFSIIIIVTVGEASTIQIFTVQPIGRRVIFRIPYINSAYKTQVQITIRFKFLVVTIFFLYSLLRGISQNTSFVPSMRSDMILYYINLLIKWVQNLKD